MPPQPRQPDRPNPESVPGAAPRPLQSRPDDETQTFNQASAVFNPTAPDKAPDIDNAPHNPDIDPETLDDEDMGKYDDQSTRVVMLPIKDDGTPNLLGADVTVLDIQTAYPDLVKARVTGSDDALDKIVERSRNYFDQAWRHTPAPAPR